MFLDEIGIRVRERRLALGLSQDRLAKLAGLSRATVNQLESGALQDLGVAKLAALLGLLGLRLEATAKPAPQRALWMASRTTSVSYEHRMEPDRLARSLATGDLEAAFIPHVATMLDDAPLALVVAAVEEAGKRSRVAPKQIWRHVVAWARELKSPREAWT